MGFEVLTAVVMKISTFWDIKLRGPLTVDRVSEEHAASIFRVEAVLAACFMLLSCLAYSSTPKTETTCSSETSVHFQRTTRCYIAEGKKSLDTVLVGKRKGNTKKRSR
jgi:hypothetical protein